MSEIKKAIGMEWAKCSVDPVYFMRKYCKVQHPIRGTVNFDLYPFQENLLKSVQQNRFNIVLKSRQLGITTVAAGYSLWLMMFNSNKTVLCIATSRETSQGMVTKVKFMWENLPKWMKGGGKPDNKNASSLKLKNDSQIVAITASENSSRNYAVSFLIIDEAAFIESIDGIYTAVKPTLSTGGGCLALSSPNGVGNWFHKTWVKAENGDNNFVPVRLPWNVHPERDEAWFKDECADMDPSEIAQEYECDFLNSGNNIIPNEYISWYENETVCDPIEKRYMNDYWLWEYVDFSESYFISVDVSRGDGSDYSTFHVISSKDCRQVAEYRAKVDTRTFASHILGAAREFNDALVVIENANMGWDVVMSFVESGYPNLYYSPKGDDSSIQSYLDKINTGNVVPGFTNSSKTRPLILSKLQTYIKDKSITIRSKRTIEELKTFIWSKGKAQAQHGYNDDLIMALSIGLYIRDTSLSYHEFGLASTIASLTNIHSNTPKVINQGAQSSYDSNIKRKNQTPNHLGYNPWSFRDSYGKNQDMSWLL